MSMPPPFPLPLRLPVVIAEKAEIDRLLPKRGYGALADSPEYHTQQHLDEPDEKGNINWLVELAVEHDRCHLHSVIVDPLFHQDLLFWLNSCGQLLYTLFFLDLDDKSGQSSVITRHVL